MLHVMQISLLCYYVSNLSHVHCNKIDNMSIQIDRDQIRESEKVQAVNFNELNTEENNVNELILKLKLAELNNAKTKHVKIFPPTESYLINNDNSNNTESHLLKIIRRLPKGGSLHTHLLAAGSSKLISSLIKKHIERVWVSNNSAQLKVTTDPSAIDNPNFTWQKLVEVPLLTTIHSELVIANADNSSAELWPTFRKIFSLVFDFLRDELVFKEYVTGVLTEGLDDGLQYFEFRTTFLNFIHSSIPEKGKSHIHFVDVFRRVVASFAEKHKHFIGAKLIVAPYRRSTPEDVRKELQMCKEATAAFPSIVAGFDLVGNEDDGHPLSYFWNGLFAAKDDVQFYFHAAESNHLGDEIDDNLMDAILLGSKRIGHAYTLPRRPKLGELVRQRGIAIEVCPISNKILGLVNDLRNHPASMLIAHGYPVVICSDDPGAWDAFPMSSDWYVTLLTLAQQSQGLGFIKQLAINSIKFSAMTPSEVVEAEMKFNSLWSHTISTISSEIAYK